MPFRVPFSTDQLEAFLISLAIGLLIGLERERVSSARAGLRTFSLVALLGTLTALLATHTGSVLPIAAGILAVAATIIAAYLKHPDPQDPGTTSVAALLVCFCLGVAVWYGYARLAIMLALGTTMLLYFKAELRGVATRLTARDWISILEFGVVSLIILPILPDQNYGPYGALNPYQVWWMVVLISGVSLAGYAALQIGGSRYGAPFVGLFGGIVSSTATTMVYARNAAADPALAPVSALVILLANMVMVVRVSILAAVLAPSLVLPTLLMTLPAIALGGGALLWNWHLLASPASAPLPETKNPTEMRTALGFGALYAVVLFCAAWLSDYAGNSGLYVVALVSGLTDIDAIALSSLRLFGIGKLEAQATVVAIGLAMFANLSFKTGLAVIIGGRPLTRRVLLGMGAVGIGLLSGVAWTQFGQLGQLGL